MVAVRLVFGEVAVGAVNARARFLERLVEGRAVEDVALRLRDVVEGADVGLEVLCQDLLRIAQEQLGYEVGVVLAEVSLTEHEEELNTLVSCLDRVWYTSREEPAVLSVYIRMTR